MADRDEETRAPSEADDAATEGTEEDPILPPALEETETANVSDDGEGIRFLEFNDLSEDEEFRRIKLPAGYPVQLLIRSSLFQMVLEQALAAAPLHGGPRRETGGIFAGEIIKEKNDDEQEIARVYIRDYLPVGDGTLIEFTITQENWAEAGPKLRALNLREGRNLIYIGVFHSHPGHGVFHSADDRKALGKENGLLTEYWQFSMVIDHISRSDEYPFGYGGIFFDNTKVAEFGLERLFPHLRPLLEGGKIGSSLVTLPDDTSPDDDGIVHPDSNRSRLFDFEKVKSVFGKFRSTLLGSIIAAACFGTFWLLWSKFHRPPTHPLGIKMLQIDTGTELRPHLLCEVNRQAFVLHNISTADNSDLKWQLNVREANQPTVILIREVKAEALPVHPERWNFIPVSKFSPGYYQFQVVAKSKGNVLLAKSDWSATKELSLKQIGLKIDVRQSVTQEPTSNHLNIELSWNSKLLPEAVPPGTMKLYREQFTDMASCIQAGDVPPEDLTPLPKVALNPVRTARYTDRSLIVYQGQPLYIRYWLYGTMNNAYISDSKSVQCDFKRFAANKTSHSGEHKKEKHNVSKAKSERSKGDRTSDERVSHKPHPHITHKQPSPPSKHPSKTTRAKGDDPPTHIEDPGQ